MEPDAVQISHDTLQRLFKGVTRAQRLEAIVAESISRWISREALREESILELGEWRRRCETHFHNQENMRGVVDIALGVAYLRDRSESGHNADMDLAWSLVNGSLDNDLCRGDCFRGPQGFFAVHLCSLLLEAGKTDELYRLHVWLPGDPRGEPAFQVHSHQAFGQSWILAGEGRNTSYHVESCQESEATHSKYEVRQNFEMSEDGERRKRVSSTLQNTRDFVKVSVTEQDTHHRGMTYTMGSGTFHSSDIQPAKLHATLFLFDSHRGWEQDAPVLGPKDGESHKNERYQSAIRPKYLKQAVEDVIEWEKIMAEAEGHTKTSSWENALERYDHALRLCKSSAVCSGTPVYTSLTLGNLGSTYRRFGRYREGKQFMAEALEGMPECKERVWLLGEMGVLLRHDHALVEAKAVLEEQHETSHRLDLPLEISRACGNLGMVNYQLYKINHDKSLLEQAIAQCTERVKTSHELGNLTWELVGLSRLSLCYLASSQPEKALEVALRGFQASKASPDPTTVAFTQYFLGKVHLQMGEKQKALEQFNPPNTCTPAMAFCKEASGEHLEYLKELIANGANLDLIDADGYKALDYAFFSHHVATQECVTEGLKRQGFTAEEVEDKVIESRAREGYRSLFQEVLRPILRQGLQARTFQQIRGGYANSLKGVRNANRREVFDEMRCIQYSDFCAEGKLPSFANRPAPTLDLESDAAATTDNETTYIIFISYRWLNTLGSSSENAAPYPDDKDGTQYKRIRAAVEDLLEQDSSISRPSVRLWIDFACIDQTSPLPGILALPLVIAQCNAMISILDEQYYTRAWCCIEVLLVKQLIASYGLHRWYEQAASPGAKLKPGARSVPVAVSDAKLSHEGDRPKLVFLERQIGFLR